MRVNLLPGEIRERQRVRRRGGAVAVVGVLVLAALGAFYFLQQMRVNDLERDLAEQQAENDRLRGEIAELQEFDQQQRELAASEDLLNTLLVDEVRWSGVLRDISLVIPGQTWLTTLNAQITQEAEATTQPAEGPSGLIGQISFNGFGLSHRAVALWLTRLEDVEGFANPWVSTSQKTEIGLQEVVQFTSTTDLSEQVLARSQGGGA
ncbi:MAG TPA: PilN domain-containing protein [Actinomycetota bacterium]|nr:PilN domain-containing protein [Actinomycetota bacterium]